MVSADRARELLSQHGTVRRQPATDWKGPFSLPVDLQRFYGDVGPCDVDIRGYGNGHFLPSLAKLWEYQAGYRWNGRSGERLPEWDDDWLVIADEGGDPFVFSRMQGSVLFMRHGRGRWEPEELFSDPTSMAACLAAIGSVVVSAGASLVDDNHDLRQVHVAAATQHLTALLGSPETAEAVLATLGWG